MKQKPSVFIEVAPPFKPVTAQFFALGQQYGLLPAFNPVTRNSEAYAYWQLIDEIIDIEMLKVLDLEGVKLSNFNCCLLFLDTNNLPAMPEGFAPYLFNADKTQALANGRAFASNSVDFLALETTTVKPLMRKDSALITDQFQTSI